MPSTMLFAINTEGRLFGLSTTGMKWKEFPYLGVEFKQISAVPNFLWAVGGDRQIYLHAHGLDIPIRVKEEIYENERWFPVEGFGKRLLPTDRYHWSTKDGKTERRKEQVRLPSMAWQWEGGWQLELTLDGQPLDCDGWTYAMDFPSSYVAAKQWTSCVRRRKWYRYRRYAAMYTWCAISPLNKDPTQEPFIHIAVGGHKQVNENKGALLVWAVTAYGRVMFRNGVCFECPEGTRWSNVSIPQEVEVKSINCGPTGLVWALLWNGKALVRYGISSYVPTGEKWLEVEPPSCDLKLVQLSVGTNSVWSITSDNKVWFRKGIVGFPTEETATGTGWIEMCDKMIYVTTSANDQLWAIDEINRKIHYRYGIDENEMTGRKWMRIQCPRQLNGKSKKSVDSGNSSMTCDSLNGCTVTLGSNSYPEKSPSVISKSIVRSWSPIRSAGSVLGVEANPDTDDTCLDLDKEKDVFREKDDLTRMCESDEMNWTCVEAGAVHFNPSVLPKWFVKDWKEQTTEPPWRASILKELRLRHVLEQDGFKEYQTAEQINYWKKSVSCKYFCEGKKLPEESILQIELTVWNNNTTDKGMLIILSADKKQIKCQVDLEDIICIMDSSEPSQPSITVHTSNSLDPIKILICSENDFHDWISSLSSVCCKVKKVNGLPRSTSLWSVTEHGHIYVMDTVQSEKHKVTENGNYCTELKFKECKLPLEIKFLNEFSIGSELTINATIPDNADRFAIDLISCLNGNGEDVVFHFNPRFNDGIIVRNSKLSNKWGSEETEGNLAIKPNTNFTMAIVCLKKYYKIFINGSAYTCYDHRISPCYVTSFRISGDIMLHHAIYETDKRIIRLDEMFLRRIDGHLSKIQSSCNKGVVWGLSFDHTLWSLIPSAFDTNYSNGSIMTDAKEIFIYENQRWNPLNGFVDIMLPTDRYKWSDESGKIKMTKDSVKLQNMHWKWICDWQIDYKTKGGVDKEGWQYALDFPSSYHSCKTITDTVRRRRWVRRCKLTINAPWEEIGSTKLIDIALHGKSNDGKISGWGITMKGDVLYRNGVTTECSTGESWFYVESEEPMIRISCNGSSQVWCCGTSGTTYWRLGITENNPIGDSWVYVEPPTGVKLKDICIAKHSVWALDNHGNIFVRMDVTPVFPEGTSWNQVMDTSKFKKISACGTSIWAINELGLMCRRVGSTEDNPKGLQWVYGLPGNWRDISE